MKALSVLGAALVATLIASAAMADPPAQPPMNDFYEAFYLCDSNTAFMVSYDSDTPTGATLTTSTHNRAYELKRTASASGFQFQGAAAKFWTDGKAVTVSGTDTRLEGCKLKKG